MTGTTTDILARLAVLRQGDVPVHGGRTLAYVYASGLDEVDRVGREAVAAFSGTNGLDPTAFPSLLQMENDLVAFGARLLDAPDTVVGTVTSGGTESVLLAVQAARDAHPEITSPSTVLPSSAPAACAVQPTSVSPTASASSCSASAGCRSSSSRPCSGLSASRPSSTRCWG